MKKLLFAALLLSGLAFAAPSAEAGSCRTVFVGYDRCGRPVYQQVQTHNHYQPRASYYNAPTYYRSSNYGRSYNYGRSHYDSRCSNSRSRFSVSFGF